MNLTLTNYWFLILWVLVVGGTLNILAPKRVEFIEGRERQVWPYAATLFLVLPYCIWGGFRVNFGDTEMYRKTFNAMTTGLSGFSEFFSSETKDKFFYAFEYLVKTLISTKPEVFFLIVATIQVVIVALLYRKYSCDWWLSFFIFIASTDYLSWVLNGMRQFLAVTIIYAATPLLLKKKYIPLVITIILAAQFHGSALLMLPVVFILQGKALNKKTLLCIALSILALVFVGRFTSLLDTMLAETQYTNVVSDWQSWNDDGMNPIRVLVYSVPTLTVLLGYRFIKEEDDPVVNMAANASILTTALAIIAMGTSGIFMGRLPIYTSLYANGIMLPWAIDHMFEKKSALLVKLATMGLYLAFFYYQMHFTWGVL